MVIARRSDPGEVASELASRRSAPREVLKGNNARATPHDANTNQERRHEIHRALGQKSGCDTVRNRPAKIGSRGATAASVFERPRTRCIPAHHGGRNDRRDCSPAMREHEDRQHLQDAYPREDAHAARRGAGALCDAPQTFRRQRRTVSATRTLSTHQPISTTCRNWPARASGSAQLTAPTPAS